MGSNIGHWSSALSKIFNPADFGFPHRFIDTANGLRGDPFEVLTRMHHTGWHAGVLWRSSQLSDPCRFHADMQCILMSESWFCSVTDLNLNRHLLGSTSDKAWLWSVISIGLSCVVWNFRVYKARTMSDEDPKNLVLLCTSEGRVWQRQGRSQEHCTKTNFNSKPHKLVASCYVSDVSLLLLFFSDIMEHWHVRAFVPADSSAFIVQSILNYSKCTRIYIYIYIHIHTPYILCSSNI